MPLAVKVRGNLGKISNHMLRTCDFKISVITAVYNSERFIECAIRSLDMQEWGAVEHIVVDGASNDGTLSAIRKYSRPERQVISEPDSGIYDAMNKGLARASGDIIGFLNSDDFYATPQALRLIAGAFCDPDIEACYGDLDYVDRENVDIVVRRWRAGDFSPGIFAKGWCPPHPTFYVRRRVFERFGGFNSKYRIAADVELMARLLEMNRIKTQYIPHVLVKMRLGGVTNRSIRNILVQNLEVLKALRAHGMQLNLVRYVTGKLVSRGRQFLP